MNKETKQFYRKVYLLYGEEFSFMDVLNNDILGTEYISNDMIDIIPRENYFKTLDEFEDMYKFTKEGLKEILYGIN